MSVPAVLLLQFAFLQTTACCEDENSWGVRTRGEI
jgi:hypothetical protein